MLFGAFVLLSLEWALIQTLYRLRGGLMIGRSTYLFYIVRPVVVVLLL